MLISEKLSDLSIISKDFADVIQSQTGDLWLIINKENQVTEISKAAQSLLQLDADNTELSISESLHLDASSNMTIKMFIKEARETFEAFFTPAMCFFVSKDKQPVHLSIIPQGTDDENKIIIGLKKLDEQQQSITSATSTASNPDANKKLSITLNSIGEGVITTDPNGNIELINPAAENIIGCDCSGSKGKHLSSIFRLKSSDEKNKRLMTSPVDEVISSGLPIGSEHICLIDANDKERVIAFDLAPIINNYTTLGTVLVFNDLTHKLKLDTELQKIHKMESLAVLSSGIAHDFNNFLTSIMGNLSLGKRYIDSDDKLMPILNAAERGTKRAKYLTDRLFTFSKGTSPIKSNLSIKNLINDSTSLILSGCNCKCDTHLADNLWVAEVDEGQISQVLNNLLINAHQAMLDGGNIHIEAKNERMIWDRSFKLHNGPFVKIKITDEGCGIATENLNKLFEPYFTTKPTGNGLGLATTYSIIKAHRGHIDVESTVGRGTTFTIYLPANPSVKLRDDKNHTQQIHFGTGRILLMDDEEIIQQIAGDMLSHLGYTLDFSINGEEAVSKYKLAKERGTPYDAVILDLSVVAGAGGLESLELLKKIDPDVKAIISTGYAHNPEVLEHKKYGFKASVIKPYNIEQMSWTIKTVLDEK